MKGVAVADGDEGYYYIWLCGVHCLMGDEGFNAGFYTVRATEKIRPSYVMS